ncbi:hypothetical protein Q8A67_012982 [Cirrhinus molitorella]|uniref:Uncharacterized protein n=1 Tax=Cirrhinus molitorella TaxID=172907 RepID=A0AA88PNT5_9TELE|nr:hypothetical protein Q8A67_012982 [Cirrhinus molitorella]
MRSVKVQSRGANPDLTGFYKCEREWQPLLPNGSLSLCNAQASSGSRHPLSLQPTCSFGTTLGKTPLKSISI